MGFRGRGPCEFTRFSHKTACVPLHKSGTAPAHPPTTTTTTSACLVPIDTQITGTIPPTETSLPALQSCFSTSETKGCLFHPLLSANFFAPGTRKPLKVLLSGQYRLLPNPHRKLGGGGHKRCQEPIKASFFLPDLRT